MLICNHRFHSVFIRESSGCFSTRWLSYRDGMKPVVTDKHRCISLYTKTNIYIYTYYYYLIALSQILSTLQIIQHLVCHNKTPTSEIVTAIHCGDIVSSKLATVVTGDQKVPFSIATTPMCRGGCYSFPWIAPLYPWYIPYIAEC